MNAVVKAHQAQWCALVVIPSAGHKAPQEGTKNVSRRTPANSKVEREIRIRTRCYCNEHKARVTLDKVMRKAEIQAWCARLQSHYGHGALLADQAVLDWEPIADGEPAACCIPSDAAPVTRKGGRGASVGEEMMG